MIGRGTVGIWGVLSFLTKCPSNYPLHRPQNQKMLPGSWGRTLGEGIGTMKQLSPKVTCQKNVPNTYIAWIVSSKGILLWSLILRPQSFELVLKWVTAGMISKDDVVRVKQGWGPQKKRHQRETHIRSRARQLSCGYQSESAKDCHCPYVPERPAGVREMWPSPHLVFQYTDIVTSPWYSVMCGRLGKCELSSGPS